MLMLLLILLPLSMDVVVSAAAAIPKKGVFYGRAQQRVAGVYSPSRQNNSGGAGRRPAPAPALLIFNLSIGTQSLPFVMEITSELVWALCSSCNVDAGGRSCLGVVGTPPAPAFFQPPPAGRSSSFSAFECAAPACQDVISQTCAAADDHCGYAGESYESSHWEFTTNTSGYLAAGTFRFGTIPVDDLVFSCGDDVGSTVDLAGASGVAGFNRGSLSMASQLHHSSFSYLISSDESKSFVAWSWEKAGAPAVQTSRRSRSTPLLPPEATPIPYFYYVNLTGVEVDGQALPIPAETFGIRVNGSGSPQSGGVILSTTEPVTYLEKVAYDAMRAELVRRIMAQLGVSPVDPHDLDHLCYMSKDLAGKKVPAVTLVFDGCDARMELDVKNYFFNLPVDSGAAGGQQCLTIVPSIGGSDLGSLLQMDMIMTIDMDRELLTFDRATTAAAAAFPLLLLLLVCLLFF